MRQPCGIALGLLCLLLAGCGGSGGGGGGSFFGDEEPDLEDRVVLLTTDALHGHLFELDAFDLDDDDLPPENVTGEDPSDVAVDFDLGLLYVAVPDDDSVDVFDAYSLNFEFSIVTGDRPVAVAVNSDIHVLYVIAQGDDLLEMYDAENGDFLGEEETSNAPSAVLWYDAGNFVYVASPSMHRVEIFGDDDLDFIRAEDIDDDGGEGPVALAVDGLRNELHVVCADTENLLILDATDLSLEADLPVGDQPEGIALSVALNRVFVSNSIDDTVSGFALDTRTELPDSPVDTGGNRPGKMAIHENAGLLYIINGDSEELTVLRASTLNEYGPSPYILDDEPVAVLVPRDE